MTNHPNRSIVSYEWVLEIVSDDKNEDVGQLDHFETLCALIKQRDYLVANGMIPEGERWEIELSRTIGNDGDGITGRQYVRLRDGALPERFDDEMQNPGEGAMIPKRFHDECHRAYGAGQAERWR